MPIVLFRIDDRLIHGQVTIGWAPALRVAHVAVIDDAVAESAWEQELYRAAAPEGATLEFVTQDTAAGAVTALVSDPRRTLVLVRSPAGPAALARAGVALPPVNVGGMHFAAGKRELLPYLFVDDSDVASFRALLAAGVSVTARDLPSSTSREVGALLSRDPPACR